MNIIKYPAHSDWSSIVERPHMDLSKLNATVSEVLNDMRQQKRCLVKYEVKQGCFHITVN